MSTFKLVAISIFTFGWYWSSSVNAVATQQLLHEFRLMPDSLSPEEQSNTPRPIPLSILLTTMQLLIGGALSMALISIISLLRRFSFFGAPPSSSSSSSAQMMKMYPPSKTKPWHTIGKIEMIIGLLHFCGAACTNIGFGYGSASLVNIIKLLEPIETLVLAALVHVSLGGNNKLSDVVSLQKVTSTLIIISGTSMLLTGHHGHKKNPSLPSIAFAIASGFCMATRNVLKKRKSAPNNAAAIRPPPPMDCKDSFFLREQQNNLTTKISNSFVDVLYKGLKSFASVTIVATLPALFATAIALVFQIIPLQIVSFFLFQYPPTRHFVQAVTLHGFYNMASLTVLSLTTAPVHSLLNVGKRIANVLTVAVVFSEPLPIRGIVGIFCAAMGAFLYSADKNPCLRRIMVRMTAFWQMKKTLSNRQMARFVLIGVTLFVCAFIAVEEGGNSASYLQALPIVTGKYNGITLSPSITTEDVTNSVGHRHHHRHHYHNKPEDTDATVTTRRAATI